MKAIAIMDFGGRNRLQLMELPRPEAGAGEVLIKVHAAGVNPVDWKIREGLLRTRLPHQFPVILGWDAAGVVETGGKKFRPGDEVYAYCRKPIVQHGAYADYIAVPESSVALKPRKFSFLEAAAVPLAALTAYQALFDAAGLKRGQTVLIHAAAGGVGGFAVQLAKERGARVLATASAAKHDYVRGLGADEVVDYQGVDFRKAIRKLCPDGVDVVFDTVGGAVQTRSAEVVKRGGVLVSILAFADTAAIEKRGVRPEYVFVCPNGKQLAKLTELAEAGRLRTRVEQVFPLKDAAKAHALIEAGHSTGKIVLRIS